MDGMDLFDAAIQDVNGVPAVGAGAPLAVRMRPASLAEVAGQAHLLVQGSPLRRLVEPADSSSRRAAPGSVILWGPPGTGKTTLAYLIAASSGRRFVELSAVTAGVKDVRQVIEDARRRLSTGGAETVLFIDEVHRFSKSQQDALLPSVENRWVTLVAATTENPSFSVNSPLLSRSLLLTLQPLTTEDVRILVRRAVADERGLAGSVELSEDAEGHLLRLAGGDARKALTILEAAAGAALSEERRAPGGVVPEGEAGGAAPGGEAGGAAPGGEAGGAVPEGEAVPIDEGEVSDGEAPNDVPDDAGAVPDGVGEVHDDVAPHDVVPDPGPLPDHAPSVPPVLVDLETMERAIDVAAVRYDRDGDQHYDVISAFIKSMRGSDVDAALHYLARMVAAGEDPRFIARRIVIAAAEDVGMADPSALQTATAAATAVALIGMPEARIILAEAVVHIATAPKSNAAYMAIDAALADIRAGKVGTVPPHLRDGHYAGAKALGHSQDYIYSHDEPHAVATQQYLPDDLVGAEYYRPSDRGFERSVTERLDKVKKILRGKG